MQLDWLESEVGSNRLKGIRTGKRNQSYLKGDQLGELKKLLLRWLMLSLLVQTQLEKCLDNLVSSWDNTQLPTHRPHIAATLLKPLLTQSS